MSRSPLWPVCTWPDDACVREGECVSLSVCGSGVCRVVRVYLHLLAMCVRTVLRIMLFWLFVLSFVDESLEFIALIALYIASKQSRNCCHSTIHSLFAIYGIFTDCLLGWFVLTNM